MRSLAGGIAHDFNNLLMLIIGSIDAVTLDPNLSPENRYLLESAAKATVSATELSGRLLSFARHGAIVKNDTNIASFVAEHARFIARGHNLAVEVGFASDISGVAFNGTEISRVVSNLVINAMQAVEGRGGGTLRIAGEKGLFL